MIRFTCTQCKRVKRVRKAPNSVQMTVFDATLGALISTPIRERLGVCAYHHSMSSSAELRSRVRILKAVRRVRK